MVSSKGSCQLWLARGCGAKEVPNKVGVAGVADTCIGGAIYPDSSFGYGGRNVGLEQS